ncbi:MAG: ABC transporter ATP-binding protein [Gallionella sp.]
MIRLASIRKRFALNGTALEVLKGITLEIDSGEFVAIMGRSGSGKSTLLNIIGCLDTPSEGTYYLKGRDVSTLGDSELAGIRNTDIGFIFQMFNLVRRNTALRNVEKPLIYRGIPQKDRERIALEMLGRVGLSSRVHHYPPQLSGGQQQRVAIARCLVTQPSLIIADEPTGSLDSNTSKEIMGILKDLNREGKTVLVVTHDPAVASSADRIINIVDGKLSCAN